MLAIRMEAYDVPGNFPPEYQHGHQPSDSAMAFSHIAGHIIVPKGFMFDPQSAIRHPLNGAKLMKHLCVFFPPQGKSGLSQAKMAFMIYKIDEIGFVKSADCLKRVHPI